MHRDNAELLFSNCSGGVDGLAERRITEGLQRLCHHQPRYFSEVKPGLCCALVTIQSVPHVLVEVKILRLPTATEGLLHTADTG